jgi:hypothetical protein
MEFGGKSAWAPKNNNVTFQYKPKETKEEVDSKELQSLEHIKKVTSSAKGLYYVRDWMSAETEESKKFL